MALFLEWLLFWMEREKDGGSEVDLEWKTERGRAGGEKEKCCSVNDSYKDGETEEEMSLWKNLKTYCI